MSELRTARKRNAWLPNRMFDPASNPFAVQNLLDRTAPPFVEQRDALPEPMFGVDPLAGGHVAGGFEYDHSLDLPDEDFALDEVIADAFVAEADESVATDTEFAAQQNDEINTTFAAQVHTDASAAAVADGVADEAALGGEVEAVDELTEGSEIAAFAAAADAMAAEISATDPATLAPAAAEIDGSEGAAAEANASEANLTEDPDAVVEDTVTAQADEGDQTAEVVAANPEDDVLDSAAVAQKIEAARAQAYEEGLEAGRTEGRESERPIAHQQGYDEGMVAGLEQGRAETQTDEQKRQQAEHQAKLDQLQSVIDQLQQLAYNPDALFEPMKKLTVHLAEQLVRGELTQSPQAISRLVDNALRELNAAGDKAVIIHLHPEDLESYRPTVEKYADSLILRPDNLLERGSVRVSLDGSVVEDLLQRRVEGVKKSMAQAPTPSWRAGGQRLSDRLQTGQPVDDVTVVEKRETSTDNTLETATPSDDHA